MVEKIQQPSSFVSTHKVGQNKIYWWNKTNVVPHKIWKPRLIYWKENINNPYNILKEKRTKEISYRREEEEEETLNSAPTTK